MNGEETMMVGQETMIEPFHVAFDRATGVLVVQGELDEWTARQVDALDLAGQQIRHIDCRGTSFLSAAGLTALLERCTSGPVTMTASRQVRRVIEICHLGEVFLIDPDGG